jgi:hypothetical protein
LKFQDYNYDFYSSVGFTGMLFCIYEIICTFSSRADNYQNLFSFIPIKAKYLPVFYLFCNQLINPNSSYIGHASGIICGWLIKNIFVFFTLPKKANISSFEKVFVKYIDFLETKFQYIKIDSITDNSDLVDLNEMNKNLLDSFLFRKIIGLIKGDNKQVNENMLINNHNNNNSNNLNNVNNVNSNNNNNPREIINRNELQNINRLEEEI